MIKKILLILFIIFQISHNAFALSFNSQSEHVNLHIIPEYKTLSKDTQNLTIIARADIAKGWHLYWDNPGDIGTPTTLDFYDSIHYNITENQHSSPHKSVYEDIITSYIYTETMYFKTTFNLTDIKNISRLPFSLVLSYTACNQSCEKESIRLDFALPIKDMPEENPTYFETIDNAESTFPLSLNITGNFADDILELDIAENILHNCSEAEFVSRHPKKDSLATLPQTQSVQQGKLHINFGNNDLPPDFNGILLCPGHAYYLEPSIPVTRNETTSEVPMIPVETSSNVWYYILTAFIAGLILNLMPCVLPVLSLKALHLVQNPKHISPLSGISYLLGVVSSFLILASVLFYLRSIGEELGWGFQLQSPLFNVILLILFIFIFLSLIDKLPISVSFVDKLSRLSGNQSFLTGFFAVLIACPCTGPFMGAALGYAITKPTLIYFSIFLSLGLGYALPYTLIEVFPKFFLRYIPKPGMWMLTFKKILSVPILLTCFWLVWVIANQLRPAVTPSQNIIWETYTPAKVEQALSQNQPVFINFTAKWCLVCLLNDKSTLSTDTFKELASQKNIRLFKADWTNNDSEISTALKQYNRNSIPLYVWYPPKQNAPIILPQILTPEIIREHFSQVK